MSTPSPSAADLPADVLCLIQSFLPLFDYLRFPAVCSSWRNAARYNPRPSQPDQPCLFYIGCSRVAVARQFFPQKPQKIYQMPLPKPFQRRRTVSAAEHLLIVMDRKSELKEMYLLNPFSWTEIGCLPSPIASLRLDRSVANRWPERIATDGNYVVAIVSGKYFNWLVYSWLGSDHWIDLRCTFKRIDLTDFADVIPSHLQKALFYAVRIRDYSGNPLMAISFDLSTSTIAYTDITFNLTRDFISKESWPTFQNTRLVVSSSDLYVVRWALIKEAKGVYSRVIDVYKLPLTENAGEQRRWVKAESLGGCCFFLGRNQSISVSAVDFPQLRGDCIFLRRYPFQGWGFEDQYEYDAVYNLGDKSWERLYGLDDQSNRNGVWILPRLV